ncbi:MAG TPA: hypothetical protein VFT43_10100 [Candidatus Polarisedimenticolia bacterium]|nr:hypothetical protein [Candidatus Polarisedimenticolia bacterium]
MTTDPGDDREHLRLLSIFHYVLGGITGLFSFLPLLYVGMGILLVRAPDRLASGGGQPPPGFLGWLLAAFGGALFLLGGAYTLCLILSGRFLVRRRHYRFCLVTAGFACVFMPLGTVLGVFTIFVLTRPSVRALFTDAGTAQPG